MSDEPYVKNASDEGQVKDAERKVRFGRRQELDDVRVVLSTVEGRRFFWRLMTFCGIFRTSFTGNSETYYREGQRNVGLKLMADMNEADPDSYAKMQRESQVNKEKKDESRNNRGRSE